MPLICIEDLNIKGMQKRWGRKISDYGFSEFIKILEYKAREIGSIVQKIDRYYPSSQICHVCGTKNPETKNLAVREWICAKCKTSHDRDRNAAINIWKVGASNLLWRDIVRPAILVGKYRLYQESPAFRHGEYVKTCAHGFACHALFCF